MCMVVSKDEKRHVLKQIVQQFTHCLIVHCLCVTQSCSSYASIHTNHTERLLYTPLNPFINHSWIALISLSCDVIKKTLLWLCHNFILGLQHLFSLMKTIIVGFIVFFCIIDWWCCFNIILKIARGVINYVAMPKINVC